MRRFFMKYTLAKNDLVFLQKIKNRNEHNYLTYRKND